MYLNKRIDDYCFTVCLWELELYELAFHETIIKSFRSNIDERRKGDIDHGISKLKKEIKTNEEKLKIASFDLDKKTAYMTRNISDIEKLAFKKSLSLIFLKNKGFNSDRKVENRNRWLNLLKTQKYFNASPYISLINHTPQLQKYLEDELEKEKNNCLHTKNRRDDLEQEIKADKEQQKQAKYKEEASLKKKAIDDLKAKSLVQNKEYEAKQQEAQKLALAQNEAQEQEKQQQERERIEQKQERREARLAQLQQLKSKNANLHHELENDWQQRRAKQDNERDNLYKLLFDEDGKG